MPGSETPLVGVAHGPTSAALLRDAPGAVDYVEVPFEHLRHDPATADELDGTPVVLHCASMSIAGFVDPEDATLAAIDDWATRVATPWIGEHLAFISADHPDTLSGSGDRRPTELTYTMSPQMSEAVLDRVERNLARLRERVGHEIIVENSPLYIDLPGSAMSQTEFVTEVVRRTGVGLLLDLTHLTVSGHNLGFDPAAALDELPLDHVVEVHVSGMTVQSDVAWDDHSSLAGPTILGLLDEVLRRAAPRAVTFEYNWAPDIPLDGVLEQFEHVRTPPGRPNAA